MDLLRARRLFDKPTIMPTPNGRSPLFSGPLSLLTISTILLLIISCKTNKVEAFKCYVCDSKSDIECTENLPANSRLTPKDCNNITGAKYCIKTTNLYAGEFGTKRFCAANDHGNYCKFISQPTGDREYRSCVLTCDSENCNGTNALLNGQHVIYVASIWILLSYILMTILTF